ncbi:MAG TPA: methyl-accepting chemotaxis protein [Candidatus Acidoferrum sp.]|nr:methyl-accepting chemotaxis protein [Candidatus Acidoferrum sp.]
MFQNLKVGTKLMLGFAVVLVLTSSLGIFALMKLAAVRHTTVDMAENWLPSVRALAELRDQAATLRRFQFRLLLCKTEEQKTEAQRGITKSIEDFKAKHREYVPMISSPEEKTFSDAIMAQFEQFQQSENELGRLVQDGKSAAADEYTMSVQKDLYEKLLAAIQQDVDLNNKGAAESSRQSSQIYSSARIWIIGVLIFGIIVGFITALTIASVISKPVQEVAEVAKRIAAGDLTGGGVSVRSNDEIGKLSADINLMHNNLKEVIQSISETAQNVANASEEFSAVSQQIGANSEETSAQANAVTTATDQVNRGLQTVATATEEMSASIREIAKNTTEAAKVADSAMRTAQETNAVVTKLGESSAEIGQVIKVITSIAQKTDLLALNATVEAARAGEVGAGFAVVANEVKELAKQTAAATEDISRKIEAIQADAKGAVAAIASISGVIGQVNNISGTIATAVEEQSATTSEMSRNVTEAARGASEVAQNIQGVAQAAQSTSHGATDSQKAAKSLAEMSTYLRELVGRFKLDSGQRSTASAHSGNNRSSKGSKKSEEYEEEFAVR